MDFVTLARIDDIPAGEGRVFAHAGMRAETGQDVLFLDLNRRRQAESKASRRRLCRLRA